jgi:hypothetical protein
LEVFDNSILTEGFHHGSLFGSAIFTQLFGLNSLECPTKKLHQKKQKRPKKNTVTAKAIRRIKKPDNMNYIPLSGHRKNLFKG